MTHLEKAEWWFKVYSLNPGKHEAARLFQMWVELFNAAFVGEI